MRILHAIPGLVEASGGPTTALIGLACAQARSGGEVTVVTTLRDGQVVASADFLSANGIRLVCIEGCRGPFSGHLALGETIRQLVFNSEIVHAHGVWEDVQYQVGLACEALGTPYIIRCCGLLDEWSLRRKWFRKRAYRLLRLDRMLDHAAAVHCSTRAEADSTSRLGFKAPVVIEPNGVALEEFVSLPARGGFRRRYHVGNAPLIVFLGRIHPGKGLEYLVPALRHVTTAGAVLAVVGADSDGHRAAVQRLVGEFGLGERVVFTGPLRGEDKIQALVDADVFCLPSEHENFGIAIVEAMAAGCPVVVSEHVGLREEIRTAQVGSVTSLQPSAVASAIDFWLQDASARRHAGARARTVALQDYDWTAIAARWMDHYRKMVEVALSKAPHSRSCARLQAVVDGAHLRASESGLEQADR